MRPDRSGGCGGQLCFLQEGRCLPFPEGEAQSQEASPQEGQVPLKMLQGWELRPGSASQSLLLRRRSNSFQQKSVLFPRRLETGRI